MKTYHIHTLALVHATPAILFADNPTTEEPGTRTPSELPVRKQKVPSSGKRTRLSLRQKAEILSLIDQTEVVIKFIATISARELEG